MKNLKGFDGFLNEGFGNQKVKVGLVFEVSSLITSDEKKYIGGYVRYAAGVYEVIKDHGFHFDNREVTCKYFRKIWTGDHWKVGEMLSDEEYINISDIIQMVLNNDAHVLKYDGNIKRGDKLGASLNQEQ